MTCKEGEGVVRFKPLYFSSPNVEVTRKFQVVVIDNNNVILSEYGVIDNPSEHQDVIIEPWARTGQFCLTIPKGIFLTHYAEKFDVIVRVNGDTVQFFANVGREDG